MASLLNQLHRAYTELRHAERARDWYNDARLRRYLDLTRHEPGAPPFDPDMPDPEPERAEVWQRYTDGRDAAQARYDALAARDPALAEEMELRLRILKHQRAIARAKRDIASSARRAERAAQRATTQLPRVEARVDAKTREAAALVAERERLVAERGALNFHQRTKSARWRVIQRSNAIERRILTIDEELKGTRRVAQNATARAFALKNPEPPRFSLADYKTDLIFAERALAEAVTELAELPSPRIPPEWPDADTERPAVTCPPHVAKRYTYNAETGTLAHTATGTPLAPRTSKVYHDGVFYPVLSVIATLIGKPGIKLRKRNAALPPTLHNLYEKGTKPRATKAELREQREAALNAPSVLDLLDAMPPSPHVPGQSLIAVMRRREQEAKRDLQAMSQTATNITTSPVHIPYDTPLDDLV